LSGAACLEGMCHLARKDFRAAAASFQRQLRATQVTGDRVGRTQALDGLTECYASGGKFEKAAEAAEECLSLMEGMEDVAGEINFRFKFGMVLWKLSWYKDAVANYKKIATLSARVADVKSSRDANLCLCRVMEAM
jgi:tetratricopeptide (TPR) repeat protein